jgi:hypothetical protein
MLKPPYLLYGDESFFLTLGGFLAFQAYYLNIGVDAFGYAAALLTMAAGGIVFQAVERFGQSKGQRHFAGTRRAGNKVAVGHPAAGQALPQEGNGSILPD